jgi:hypothetical protein
MSLSDEELIEALAALPVPHRAAFAASVSERLFPNYEAFVADQGCGDPAALREGLDAVWTVLEGGTIDEGHLRELMGQVEGAGPNSDDFSGLFTSLAADAAAAVFYTIECFLKEDPECALHSRDRAVESIVSYLMRVAWPGYGFLPKARSVADPDAEGECMRSWEHSSPLMLAELLTQEDDLAALQAVPSLTPEMLHEMRERSRKGGLQPFKRGLVKREDIPANPRPVPPPMFCDVCEGGGGTEEEPCERCGGTGRVRNRLARDAEG